MAHLLISGVAWTPKHSRHRWRSWSNQLSSAWLLSLANQLPNCGYCFTNLSSLGCRILWPSRLFLRGACRLRDLGMAGEVSFIKRAGLTCFSGLIRGRTSGLILNEWAGSGKLHLKKCGIEPGYNPELVVLGTWMPHHSSNQEGGGLSQAHTEQATAWASLSIFWLQVRIA